MISKRRILQDKWILKISKKLCKQSINRQLMEETRIFNNLLYVVSSSRAKGTSRLSLQLWSLMDHAARLELIQAATQGICPLIRDLRLNFSSISNSNSSSKLSKLWQHLKPIIIITNQLKVLLVFQEVKCVKTRRTLDLSGHPRHPCKFITKGNHLYNRCLLITTTIGSHQISQAPAALTTNRGNNRRRECANTWKRCY
jgi:hypothetical protein